MSMSILRGEGSSFLSALQVLSSSASGNSTSNEMKR